MAFYSFVCVSMHVLWQENEPTEDRMNLCRAARIRTLTSPMANERKMQKLCTVKYK